MFRVGVGSRMLNINETRLKIMLVGESIIEWHDMNDKPKEDWVSILVASKASDGGLIISLAYWDNKACAFVDDTYPYKVSDVVFWAYLPIVNMQPTTYFPTEVFLDV